MARRSLALLGLGLALLVAACTHDPTDLHRAVQEHDQGAVRDWIASGRKLDPTYDEPSRGIEGNYARRMGITPLMTAASLGDADMVQLLVTAGADVQAKSDTQVPGNPMLPFDFAARSASVAAARLLWERTRHADLSPRLGAHLAKALADERLDMAGFLAGITPADQLGRGIGEGVCLATDPERVVAFLEPLVPVFPAGTLDCLATYPRPDPQPRLAAIGRLVDHGAPLDEGPGGITPLMRAAAAGNTPVAEYLLARGARADVRNAQGLDAAAYAANTQCFNIAPGTAESERSKVALVERLAGAAPRSHANMPVLEGCCVQAGRSPEQRRVCKLFGL